MTHLDKILAETESRVGPLSEETRVLLAVYYKALLDGDSEIQYEILRSAANRPALYRCLELVEDASLPAAPETVREWEVDWSRLRREAALKPWPVSFMEAVFRRSPGNADTAITWVLSLWPAIAAVLFTWVTLSIIKSPPTGATFGVLVMLAVILFGSIVVVGVGEALRVRAGANLAKIQELSKTLLFSGEFRAAVGERRKWALDVPEGVRNSMCVIMLEPQSVNTGLEFSVFNEQFGHVMTKTAHESLFAAPIRFERGGRYWCELELHTGGERRVTRGAQLYQQGLVSCRIVNMEPHAIDEDEVGVIVPHAEAAR